MSIWQPPKHETIILSSSNEPFNSWPHQPHPGKGLELGRVRPCVRPYVPYNPHFSQNLHPRATIHTPEWRFFVFFEVTAMEKTMMKLIPDIVA